MNFQPIFFVIGLLLLVLGGLMIIPTILDLVIADPSWEAFAESAFLTLLIGGLCVFSNRSAGQMELSLKETFVLTTASWVFVAAFASLPFILTPVTPSHPDSVFEAVSAVTTTGATTIVGLNYAPLSLLLWRGVVERFGGIGIIFMSLTGFSRFSISG